MARNNGKVSHTVARLYKPMDCVLVRAPLLPIQSCPSLTAVAASEAVDSLTLASTDPRVRAALAIGSPSLLEALERTNRNDKKAAKVRAKVRRFVVRMATRPTPYGMFAGVAAGKWGAATDIC